MSDILYSDLQYPSGACCNFCKECCYREFTKDATAAEELTINWKDADKKGVLGPGAQVHNVEHVITDDCGNLIEECEIGYTHIYDAPVNKGRRSYDGPFTIGRIFGGQKGCKYKLNLRMTYSKCGHKFHMETCIDIQVSNC